MDHMETMTLSGSLFADMIRGGADYLSQKRTIVNDLNVFPIPDGDTGDNMYMTIDSGSCAASGESADSALCDVASKAARGMLLGARGNSGVILSRIFSGIARGFLGADSADVALIGSAFESGVAEAYGAVKVPVEGTILTVYRDAVSYANSRINESSTIESYFEDFTLELRASLARTPDLLAVLKEAGVVDSGGAGFVYIAEGMKTVLSGGTVTASETGFSKSAPSVDLSTFTADSELKFGYCTEFLLQLQNSKVDAENFDIEILRDWLDSVGESVVCFKEGTIVKTHVHTMHPGEILNHCQQYGEFLTLKIENMTLQHNETTIENRYDPIENMPRRKKYGIVAVAAGDGIKETFRSLGVDEVVDGGQSMNPSAQSFVDAFRRINADTIFVFPNNSNIVMTANQAASLYEDADVRVIKSRTVGEGYAAVSMLDLDLPSADEIVSSAEEVIAGVVTGMVSKATRDTDRDGVKVHSGDYIGFADDRIYVDDGNRGDTALILADKLGAGDYDIMLLLAGSDVTEDEAQAVVSELQKRYRRCEVIMIDGGQPIYDYIMILE